MVKRKLPSKRERREERGRAEIEKAFDGVDRPLFERLLSELGTTRAEMSEAIYVLGSDDRERADGYARAHPELVRKSAKIVAAFREEECFADQLSDEELARRLRDA